MADLTLSDGREFDVDLRQVKRREFSRLVDNQVSEEEASTIMGRAVGLSQDEVMGLSMMDWRRLFLSIMAKGMQPMADPNSVSASSSA